MIVKEAPTSRPPAATTGARPVNILMVTDHLGHAGGVIHGASRYYLQVLPRLDPARFRVHLCILRGYHPFAETLKEAGVEPIFLSRSKWDPRALGDLLALTKRLDVDVLHCLAMKGCLFGRIIGRMRHIPALIHLHDTNDPGRLLGFMQRRIAPWTYKALAVSEAVRVFTIHTLGMPQDRVETLYNGVDLDAFQRPSPGSRERIRLELGIPDDAVVILLAGRVVPGKGQRLLVGLLPRILRECPRAHLLLVGDGPDLPACKAQARRLGVDHAFTAPGQRSDMPEIIAAADIATMPSLHPEGFGFAALEAAAGHRPVVAFSGGALAEIVEHGRSGLLITPCDADAFADALLELARDPARAAAMGQAGSILARRFGLKQHLDRLTRLYAEMVQSRACVDASFRSTHR